MTTAGQSRAMAIRVAAVRATAVRATAFGVGLAVAAAAAAAPSLPSLKETARTYDLRLDVTAADYPDAAVITLLLRVEKNVVNRSQPVVRVHRLQRVLRDAGAPTEGRLLVPEGAQLDFVARTIDGDGHITWLAGSDIHRDPITSRDPLSDAAEVCSYAFPAVHAGVYLESIYELRASRPLSADVQIFDGDQPLQVGRYELSYEHGRSFRFFDSVGRSPSPIRRGRAETTDTFGHPVTVARFEVRDVPARPHERYPLATIGDSAHLFAVDSGAEPRVLWGELATTLIDIEQGARWGLERERAFGRQQAMLDQSFDQRTDAIIRYLERRLRIVPRMLKAAHSFDDVFAAGEVTPIGFAQILIAMLQAGGVTAHLGLVNSAAAIEVDPRIPWAGYFDRWLVVARGDAGTRYIDIAGGDLLARQPRADCQGRTMLLASPAVSGSPDARFVKVPSSAAGDNAIERRVRVELRADGLATLDVAQAIRGEGALALQDAIDTHGRAAIREAVLADLAALVPEVDLGAVRLDGNARGGFTARVRVVTPALTLRTAAGFVLTTEPLTHWELLDALHLPPPAERQLGVDLGYPQSLRVVVRIALPPGWTTVTPLEPVKLAGPGMQFERRVRRQAGELTVDVGLQVDDPVVGVERLPALGSFLTSVARVSAAVVAAAP